jgi:ribose transport system ATP-binding protein
MVFQELSAVGHLSVAENLFLGRQPTTRLGRIDWSGMRRRATEYLQEMQIDVDVRKRMDRCPLVIRQMVEIARVLHSGARILILDEPTSALSPPETRRLFDLLRHLQTRGVALVFISHFIEDVLEICGRVTVLRDGRKIGTYSTSEVDKHTIVHAMLGRSLDAEQAGYEKSVQLPPRSGGKIVLRVEKLTRAPLFHNVDLQVSAGECLGLYGFVGAGHQELVQAVAGALSPHSGNVYVQDQRLPEGDIHQAVRRGMVLVAADRGRTLVRSAPIYQNTTLAHLRRCVGRWITPAREIQASLPVLRQVGCRPLSPQLLVSALSGGNQQKVVLAKWLLGPVTALLMDEPTRGMDVGAKEEILALVRRLRREGVAVVLASTEPELLLGHADRVLVFRRGRMVTEFCGQALNREQLMRAAA